MTEARPAIRLSELTKHFPGVVAVDRLSFEASAGEIFGLVGPDGAGKTTTLRMLAGVLGPDSGSAVVADCDVTQNPEGVKSRMSYMPQRFGLYEDLTVEDNIRFYADIFAVARAERERRAGQLLDAADMRRFGRRLAGQLSGGMKQKLGLICALIHRPQVLLLDEPTTGVDPGSRRDFWRILYALLDEGVAILMSTAYLDEAERCHRVALLHEGRSLFCDTPARLKQNLPGAVVAIGSGEPRRLRAVLTGAEGIRDAALLGDGLRLVVDRADRRIPELRARLAATDVPFGDIEQVAPSVEDLFVATISGRERNRKS
jgi:ABC-2 type transport system ATP-binding protein